MATLVDLGLLKNFSSVFTFLLVFVLVYATLTKVKLFDSNGLSAILAFVMAGLTLFFKPAVTIINFMAPWFVVILILTFFFFLFLMIFGWKSSDAASLVKNPGVYWTFIAITIVIFLFALGEASHEASENGENSVYESHFSKIFFSPQVLGTVFFLIIAYFAILFLAE